MSNVALAQAILKMLENDADADRQVRESNEPYRCMMDLARQRKMHTIPDGSRLYHDVVDELEHLLTD